MIINLNSLFGYCIIPKETFLYRGHKSIEFNDCTFFALKFWVAGAFDKNVQIWKTKKDIEVLFLVESVDSRSWTESAIPRLYSLLFPNEADHKFDDLDIKHRDHTRRNRMATKLVSDHNINGWLTSLEGGIELEVCLFSRNKSDIELLTTKVSIVEYFRDSLNRIEIFPSSKFYEKSYQRINSYSGVFEERSKIFERYQNHFNELITESINETHGVDYYREHYNNLRIKLGI